MEVLETARDNLDEQEAGEKAGVVHNGSDTDSHAGRDDDDSSTDDDADNEDRNKSNGNTKKDDDAHKDSQGLIEQYREKRRDQRVEHRRHRGVMQFRIPRTARWAMHKGERVQDKVVGIFKHHTREPGVETEV